MNMHQRQELNRQRSVYPRWYPGGIWNPAVTEEIPRQARCLLAGEMLGRDRDLCDAVIGLLGGPNRTAAAVDDGQEIAKVYGRQGWRWIRKGSIALSCLETAGSLIVAEGCCIARPQKMASG